ncbi:MAG: hypothetical protein CML22_11150 [Rheinheimera sp.]|uniref:DUF2933 domain-containing protein n=1 Tax=unclassified Arsukibacterium TaxID=2635278 RepID=UPI000C57E805|nr:MULTISPECIES: DUF2933 domain-containing protein [unclassified Arsukibacterium]MBM34848.1 hypothetical protein [Rheinheimera sp.]HAW93647.1 hypothetical protein [Candidatus Azambacteria bacterium]|tara:strand:- start:2410 stop:2691 length:282 start_codon:yes stop_codon:yes gene_type:complete
MSVRSTNWLSLHGLIVLFLVASALYFLLVEHGSHFLPYLPYLILLLCPLMHVFMHKSHSGHNQNNTSPDSNEAFRQGLEEGKKQCSQHSKQQQ